MAVRLARLGGWSAVILDQIVFFVHTRSWGQTPCLATGTVHPFAVVGGDPQDLKWKGEQVSLKCGDDNSFREHSSVHRGTVQGGGVTTLGIEISSWRGAMWDTTVIWIAVHHCQQRNVGWTCGGGRPCQLGWRGWCSSLHHHWLGGLLAGLARVIKDVPPWMMVDGAPAEVRGCAEWDAASTNERRGHPGGLESPMLYREPGGDQESTYAVLLSGSPATRPFKALWIPSARRCAARTVGGSRTAPPQQDGRSSGSLVQRDAKDRGATRRPQFQPGANLPPVACIDQCLIQVSAMASAVGLRWLKRVSLRLALWNGAITPSTCCSMA